VRLTIIEKLNCHWRHFALQYTFHSLGVTTVAMFFLPMNKRHSRTGKYLLELRTCLNSDAWSGTRRTVGMANNQRVTTKWTKAPLHLTHTNLDFIS